MRISLAKAPRSGALGDKVTANTHPHTHTHKQASKQTNKHTHTHTNTHAHKNKHTQTHTDRETHRLCGRDELSRFTSKPRLGRLESCKVLLW